MRNDPLLWTGRSIAIALRRRRRRYIKKSVGHTANKTSEMVWDGPASAATSTGRVTREPKSHTKSTIIIPKIEKQKNTHCYVSFVIFFSLLILIFLLVYLFCFIYLFFVVVLVARIGCFILYFFLLCGKVWHFSTAFITPCIRIG